MQLNRILIVWLALCGIVCAEGLRNVVGIYTNGQSLATGRVAVSTNDNTFWVGNATSNAVKVGTAGVASTNDINTATATLASTNFVNSAVAGRVATNDAAYLAAASTGYVDNAVAGYLPTNTVFGVTTNLSVLDLSTNSLTLYFTNGTLRGASSP